MKKIIGGLLVIALLSRPSLLRVDYFAYEIYKVSNQILKSIIGIQKQEEAAEIIKPDDVDTAFTNVDKNAKGITRLLADLNRVMAKMNAHMQLKALTNSLMTDEQITTLRDFSEYYNAETGTLGNTLSVISKKMEMKDVKLAIMREDTDCDQVYSELKAISDYQYEAIVGINNIILNAEMVLEIIAV